MTEALQLALIKAVTKLSTDKGENENKSDNRRLGGTNYGCCFNCKSPHHWRSECPRRRHGRNGRGHGHMKEAAQTRRSYYDEREQVYRSSDRDKRGHGEEEDGRFIQERLPYFRGREQRPQGGERRHTPTRLTGRVGGGQGNQGR